MFNSCNFFSCEFIYKMELNLTHHDTTVHPGPSECIQGKHQLLVSPESLSGFPVSLAAQLHYNLGKEIKQTPVTTETDYVLEVYGNTDNILITSMQNFYILIPHRKSFI